MSKELARIELNLNHNQKKNNQNKNREADELSRKKNHENTLTFLNNNIYQTIKNW